MMVLSWNGWGRIRGDCVVDGGFCLEVAFSLLHVASKEASLSHVAAIARLRAIGPERGLWCFQSQLAGIGPGHVGWPTGRNVVGPVVADGWSRLHNAQAALHGVEQRAHRVTTRRDFDLDPLVALMINERVRLAPLVVHVLGHIEGTLVTLGAKSPTAAVNGIGVVA